jgi:hypothetical protein
MLTNIKLFFWCPDDKIQLWSQRLHFRQSVSAFSKNGQKKCPKLKTENTFGKRKSLKYNKSSKRLKEKKSLCLHLPQNM